MRMIHSTDANRLFTIGRHGIRADRARGPHKTVWLCGPSMIGAAISHAMKRHRIAIEHVAVVTVDVPRSWLRKGERRGLRHTGGRDVLPERIEAIHEFHSTRIVLLWDGRTGADCGPGGGKKPRPSRHRPDMVKVQSAE